MSNYWPLFSRFSTCGTPEAAEEETPTEPEAAPAEEAPADGDEEK